MIIETSSTERNKEYVCFKELYLKRLDVSAKELKRMFGMGKFQSYYSLIFNRPHFFSKRAKPIYNLFIHTLKFVDYEKCFLFICINKEDKIIENKK